MTPYHFYRKLNTKSNKGFVALISAIIISVILLLIATNLSLTGFYSRSNILDGELKEISSGYAEACVDTALLKLANDSGYTGGDSVNVDGLTGDDCTYTVTGVGTKTIE